MILEFPYKKDIHTQLLESIELNIVLCIQLTISIPAPKFNISWIDNVSNVTPEELTKDIPAQVLL